MEYWTKRIFLVLSMSVLVSAWSNPSWMQAIEDDFEDLEQDVEDLGHDVAQGARDGARGAYRSAKGWWQAAEDEAESLYTRGRREVSELEQAAEDEARSLYNRARREVSDLEQDAENFISLGEEKARALKDYLEDLALTHGKDLQPIWGRHGKGVLMELPQNHVDSRVPAATYVEKRSKFEQNPGSCQGRRGKIKIEMKKKKRVADILPAIEVTIKNECRDCGVQIDKGFDLTVEHGTLWDSKLHFRGNKAFKCGSRGSFVIVLTDTIAFPTELKVSVVSRKKETLAFLEANDYSGASGWAEWFFGTIWAWVTAPFRWIASWF